MADTFQTIEFSEEDISGRKLFFPVKKRVKNIDLIGYGTVLSGMLQ
jgi:hypothetical protein